MITIKEMSKSDMKAKIFNIKIYPTGLLILLFLFLLNFNLSAQNNQGVNIKIHIKGVYSTKISLLPLSGANALKPLIEKPDIKNGQITTLLIPKDRLPGSFVLRFDYKEKETSTPYPSEKYIFINNQDLELWVKPKSVNNPDSTYFQKDEKENTIMTNFSKESGKRKEQLALIQNFLMGYDNANTKFYQQGIEEYEKRRSEYNQWITEQATHYKDLFVSHTFKFQYVPQIVFKGSEADRMQSVLAHYFDGIDFNDPILIKTPNLKDWMNSYVNIYGAMSKTEALRDSLFTLAGKRAIEKAKLGDPKVYGWMVDYFYAGYESFGIKNAMKMLQQYLDDPNCLTSKKQQIVKRIEGMEKLAIGTQAPDFTLSYMDGSDFNFHAYKASAKYKLLLFWSADCGHCQELVKAMEEWYSETGTKEKLNIVAVSLDETDAEVKKWESAIIVLPGWKHLRAKGGVNSTVANDYAILSTPVMFLVDSKSNIIKAIPDTLEQLKKELEK